jgi:hypothetical protein
MKEGCRMTRSWPQCSVCGRAGIITDAEYVIVWAVEPREHAVYGTGPAKEAGNIDYMCETCFQAAAPDDLFHVVPLDRRNAG